MAKKPTEETWCEKAASLGSCLKDINQDYKELAAWLPSKTIKRRVAQLSQEQECLDDWLSDIRALERAPNAAQKEVDAALAALTAAKAKLSDAKKAQTKAKSLREMLKTLQKSLNEIKVANTPAI
jgi:chromosome segregation ATPase